jgi:hypothetical protein
LRAEDFRCIERAAGPDRLHRTKALLRAKRRWMLFLPILFSSFYIG